MLKKSKFSKKNISKKQKISKEKITDKKKYIENKKYKDSKCEKDTALSSAVMFSHETDRINYVIKKLNQNNLNVPLVKTWSEFYAEVLEDKQQEIGDTTEFIKKTEKEYLKYIKDRMLFLIQNYNDCAEEISEINSEIILDTFRFRCNGFMEFIKHSIWNMDLNLDADHILNILILEWYDMNENERKKFRKLGIKKFKAFYKNKGRTLRQDDHLIENIFDLNYQWDSEEEWVE